MPNYYTFYLSINNDSQELIDFKELLLFDKMLENLPEFEVSDELVEKALSNY